MREQVEIIPREGGCHVIENPPAPEPEPTEETADADEAQRSALED